MAIKDRKITAWTSPVSNEADQPKRAAAEMKAVFDANSNQLKDAFNNVIDDLSGDGGTGEIGGAKFGEVDAGTLLQQLTALLALINGRPKSPDIKGIRINSDGKIEVTLDETTWQSTASSGHVIEDAEGNAVAQRSRLRFMSGTVTDEDGITVITALKGDKGDRGDTGAAGPNEISSETYTTLSGILKGASNGVTAATPGEDYAAPDHTHTPASIGAAAASHTHTPASIGAQPARLTFTNKSVATSAWASNTTYDDYPYRAAVACSGVTADMFAEVVFSPADATSGNFAPVCDTYAGGVYLYAKAVPDAAITIPTIIVWR